MRRFGDRKPTQLSGGQQQRVALARALVNRPAVLLLDEPLGALDRQLREEMQLELKLLQSRLGITFVFVTHDQGEALSMSDRIAIMRAGRIEQLADADTVYARPASAYVAAFVGQQNFFRGPVAEAGAADRLALTRSSAPPRPCSPARAAGEAAVRPEFIRDREGRRRLGTHRRRRRCNIARGELIGVVAPRRHDAVPGAARRRPEPHRAAPDTRRPGARRRRRRRVHVGRRTTCSLFPLPTTRPPTGGYIAPPTA